MLYCTICTHEVGFWFELTKTNLPYYKFYSNLVHSISTYLLKTIHTSIGSCLRICYSTLFYLQNFFLSISKFKGNAFLGSLFVLNNCECVSFIMRFGSTVCISFFVFAFKLTFSFLSYALILAKNFYFSNTCKCYQFRIQLAHLQTISFFIHWLFIYSCLKFTFFLIIIIWEQLKTYFFL
jgi:hypothetical protein